MVKYSRERTKKVAELDRVFASLANPTRREILRRLAKGPVSVTQLAAPFAMSVPAISKHLSVLERAKLLQRRRHGRQQIAYLKPGPLKEAARHVEFYRQFWNEKLDQLADFVEGGERNV